MNLKKYLQQQAEKDAESLLTESDKLFCMQLAESTVKENVRQPKAKSLKLKFTACITAVLLVAVVLGIALPIALHKNPVEILYKEENIVQTACTMQDVNSNIKYFQFNEIDDVELRPQLNYDSVSGDKLFYTVGIWTEISEISLILVVNDNYNLIFKLGEELLDKQLDIYSVHYEVKRGNNTADYLGYITLGNEIVYIKYTQLVDIGEQVFFDEIQSVLSVKN